MNKTKAMDSLKNCVICKHGTARPDFVTVTLEKKDVIIIFKNVPALVCENCGDYYLSAEMTKLLLEKANQTIIKGVEFEIINMKIAA